MSERCNLAREFSEDELKVVSALSRGSGHRTVDSIIEDLQSMNLPIDRGAALTAISGLSKRGLVEVLPPMFIGLTKGSRSPRRAGKSDAPGAVVAKDGTVISEEEITAASEAVLAYADARKGGTWYLGACCNALKRDGHAYKASGTAITRLRAAGSLDQVSGGWYTLAGRA